MLKNPKKADLDKDGKLSGYEKKRGMAIEKSMSGKRFGGVMKKSKGGGADSGRMGEIKSKLAVAKDKFKKKGMRGISSQQRERLKKIFEKKFPKTMIPLAKKEKAKGISTKAYMGGGMMKKPMGYDDGGRVKNTRGRSAIRPRGPAGRPASGSRKMDDILKNYKKFTDSDSGIIIVTKDRDKVKKMGGGMMNKPMGYKSGTSVMARGCKLGRKKATKIT